MIDGCGKCGCYHTSSVVMIVSNGIVCIVVANVCAFVDVWHPLKESVLAGIPHTRQHTRIPFECDTGRNECVVYFFNSISPCLPAAPECSFQLVMLPHKHHVHLLLLLVCVTLSQLIAHVPSARASPVPYRSDLAGHIERHLLMLADEATDGKKADDDDDAEVDEEAPMVDKDDDGEPDEDLKSDEEKFDEKDDGKLLVCSSNDIQSDDHCHC